MAMHRSLFAALVVASSLGTAMAQSPPTALEVYPPDINLETSRDRQSFVVQAWFADGLSRDVTAEAKVALANPMKARLDDGAIQPLVARLREIAGEHADSQPGLAEEILKEAEYFATNASRMNYPRFRAMGLFVGSGVIEGGCKAVIGSRLKRSGMFWTVRGANAIIALRCCRLNGRFEDFWEEARVA